MEKAPNPENLGSHFKEIGNEFFKKGDYEKALENYSKAISINDTESIFYSNRSRCYHKLKKFKEAFEDSVQAIELNDKNIKAYLICGQSLAELGKTEETTAKIEKSIQRMTKALTLCAGQKKQEYEKELTTYILRAKKLLWYKKNETLKKNKKNALEYIERLLKKENLSQNERVEKLNMIKEAIGDPFIDQEYLIPEYFKCKLSFKMIEDPVTTLSGLTYERKPLLDHIKQNGAFDPVTREPINENMIYPNLNLKQAIENFLSENPWAFEHQHGQEDYTTIEF